LIVLSENIGLDWNILLPNGLIIALYAAIAQHLPPWVESLGMRILQCRHRHTISMTSAVLLSQREILTVCNSVLKYCLTQCFTWTPIVVYWS